MVGSLLLAMVCSFSWAEGPPPPAGWGKPSALPPANGTGQVSFKHGGTSLTLPLKNIEISANQFDKDMLIVSLTYVDAKQENKFELTFGSMPKMGKNGMHTITGFVVKTKAHGLSKTSGNKTKCDLAVSKITPKEVAGTLSCKGMTDMSATEAAPDVTDVKFAGKMN